MQPKKKIIAEVKKYHREILLKSLKKTEILHDYLRLRKLKAGDVYFIWPKLIPAVNLYMTDFNFISNMASFINLEADSYSYTLFVDDDFNVKLERTSNDCSYSEIFELE